MKPKFDHAMQFKITLDGIKPPVWRRILVPCTYSFWELHVAIQDAMGWMDCHLHEFRVPGPMGMGIIRIGIPETEDYEGEDTVFPGWAVLIADLFTLINRKTEYAYDFGDGWEHTVLLEKIMPLEKGMELPYCTGGRRACPPEDCGGVYGYLDLLGVMSDPKHSDHSTVMEWVGGPFDPERFDAASVVFEDPEERWERAFGDGDQGGRHNAQ